jgi:hypothetical protein
MSNSRWCIENAVPVVTAGAYDGGCGSNVLLEEGIVLVVFLLIVFIFLFRSRIPSLISFLQHHQMVRKCMFLWDPPIVSVAVASFLWSTFPLVYLQDALVWLISNPHDQQ